MNFLLLNHTIALIFTAIACTSVSIFILIKGWKNKTNRIFAFYTFGLAWWATSQAIANFISNAAISLWIYKIMEVGVFFIPSFFFHFTIRFLNINVKNWLIKASYLLSIIFGFLSLINPKQLFIPSVDQKYFFKYYYMNVGPLFHPAFTFFTLISIYGLYQLFKAYKSSTGIKRNQLAYLSWFSLFGYIGGGTNFLISYNIYIPILHPFGTYFVGFYIIAMAYAILKYQLMDIKIATKKSLIYAILVSLIIGIMNFASFSNEWIVKKIPNFPSWIIPIIIAIATILIGNLFWRKSKEADRLKSEFITVAAHKLRTPLTKVKWALNGLSKEMSESDKKLISNISNANEQTIELTNALLGVNKTEANQYLYTLKLGNLVEITKQVLDDFQQQIKERNIRLSVNIEDNLPKVNLDKLRISSVVQILLENAITYTKNEVNINIKKEKSNIIFSIQDNGIGISKQDQPHIFSRFFRTHKAYTTETEGAGIGLFIAKNIVDKHNGKIDLRSEGEDKGSEFWFKLPV